MTDELQIDIRLEDEPDVVYPDSDQDVPEIDGLTMEPVYSEVQQALIAHFDGRDDILVAGNSFISRGSGNGTSLPRKTAPRENAGGSPSAVFQAS